MGEWNLKRYPFIALSVFVIGWILWSRPWDGVWGEAYLWGLHSSGEGDVEAGWVRARSWNVLQAGDKISLNTSCPGEPRSTPVLDWNGWDFIPLFSLSHCKGHVFLGWGGFPQLKQTQTKLIAGVQSPSLEWDLGLIHLCIYRRDVYNCLHDQSPALCICKVISGPWLCYKSPLIMA